MNKASLYLETTIPSYYTAWVSQNLIVAAHQAITQEWWQQEASKYDIYISQFVLDEAAAGDFEAAQRRLTFLNPFPLLEITPEVEALVQTIINSRLFPIKVIQDISHIAIASVHKMDYLLTWNCTHINHATTKENVRRICEAEGYLFPIICTPEELKEDTYVY
ncbi:MAG: type II toxin-antitoxin system VapC family toxin [bacterium]